MAPTSSTTATLALGDALAVALLYARGFTSSDFALSHPAGALGKRLLTTVKDLMHTNNLPIATIHHTLSQTLPIMTGGRLGLAVIVDEDDQVVGVFTDGDLRRQLLGEDLSHIMGQPMVTIMSQNPKTIDKNTKAVDALTFMTEKQVNQLLIIECGKLVGVIGIQDLSRAGIV